MVCKIIGALFFVAVVAIIFSYSTTSVADENLSVTNTSIKLCDWMKHRTDDNQLISSLSIPGTHESAATGGLWLITADRCQTRSITEQLNDGIRYFDIRLKLENDKLLIYHGNISQNKSFKEYVAEPMVAFLKTNPSEFIMMQIKREQDTENSTNSGSLYRAIVEEMGGNQSVLYREDGSMPKVGDVRGRIVVLRRNDDVPSELKPFGFMLALKDNNNTNSQCGDQRLFVQDYYNLKWVDKWQKVKQCLELSKTDAEPNKLFLNFTSCVNKNWLGIPSPNGASRQINPLLKSFLTTNGNIAKCGVILMDYYHETDGLVDIIVSKNPIIAR